MIRRGLTLFGLILPAPLLLALLMLRLAQPAAPQSQPAILAAAANPDRPLAVGDPLPPPPAFAITTFITLAGWRTPGLVPTSLQPSSHADIAIGLDGSKHIVWTETDKHVWYMRLGQDDRVEVPAVDVFFNGSFPVHIAVGGDNNAHIIVPTAGGATIPIYIKINGDGSKAFHKSVHFPFSPAPRHWSSDIDMRGSTPVLITQVEDVVADRRFEAIKIANLNPADGTATYYQNCFFRWDTYNMYGVTVQGAVDSNGVAHAVWVDSVDGSVVLRHCQEGELNIVTLAAGSPFLPDLKAGPGGRLHVAWESSASGEVFYARLLDDGSIEAGPIQASSTVSGSLRPSVAPRPDNGAFVVWAEGDAAPRSLYFAEISSAGILSQTQQLSQAPWNAWLPRVASDGHGRPHLVWTDTVNGEQRIWYTKRSPIPVLLVHGYCSGAAMWGQNEGEVLDFKQALESQGFVVETIELLPKPTYDSIWTYGAQVSAKIEEMASTYERIDIVAHSLGGLAARAYAYQNPARRHVRNLIMLGTPNYGSGLLPTYWPFLRPVLTLLFLGHPPCQGFGEAGDQMTPGSRFLRDLNGAGLPPSIEKYYTIAGTKPIPFLSALLSGPDDGVVEVSRQTIAGVTNVLADVNHFEYDDDAFVLNTVVNILRGTTSSSTLSLQAEPGIADYQKSTLIEGLAQPGVENHHAIPVDSTVSEAQFVLGSGGDELDFTLTSPGGTLITPTLAANDPLITYTNVLTTLTGYIVTNPEPGSWTAHVSISGTASSAVSYAMLALFNSDLTLSLLLDETLYVVDGQVPIRARLLNASIPVTGSTVIARIEDPTGSTQTISLYDDGSHGDVQAYDGTYSNLYTSTQAAGAYQLTVTASGTINGEQFTREAAMTIWVEAPRKIFLPLIVKSAF